MNERKEGKKGKEGRTGGNEEGEGMWGMVGGKKWRTRVDGEKKKMRGGGRRGR